MMNKRLKPHDICVHCNTLSGGLLRRVYYVHYYIKQDASWRVTGSADFSGLPSVIRRYNLRYVSQIDTLSYYSFKLGDIVRPSSDLFRSWGMPEAYKNGYSQTTINGFLRDTHGQEYLLFALVKNPALSVTCARNTYQCVGDPVHWECLPSFELAAAL